MFRATTPMHIWTVPFNTGDIEKIRITYKQDGKDVLKKTEADCDNTINEIRVLLTQEETLLFKADQYDQASAHLKVKTKDGKVWEAEEEGFWVKETSDSEVL